MIANGSVAVWCVPRPSSRPTTMEAHFNYWRVAGDPEFRRSQKGGGRDFIEVGVLVDDPAQVESICVFLPVTVDASGIVDCAPKFEIPSIAQGIFNEVLTSTAAVAGEPQCVVLSKSDGVFCRVHRFVRGQSGIDPSELGISPLAGGTLLSITRAAIDQACLSTTPLSPTYFRLRVMLGDGAANPFIQVVPTPDRWFQSGFDEIEYLDFRMNEARTLPTRIETLMRNDRAKGGAVDLKLVAFLTAVPVSSGLAVANAPSHKMRLLEHDLWQEYVSGGIPRSMVVYHWKRDALSHPITDFTAFVKMQTRRSGWKILLTYLAIAFAFGVLGNLAASALQGFYMINCRIVAGSPSSAGGPAAQKPLIVRAGAARVVPGRK